MRAVSARLPLRQVNMTAAMTVIRIGPHPQQAAPCLSAARLLDGDLRTDTRALASRGVGLRAKFEVKQRPE